MGVSPLMSIGVKAMTANYAALQTTSHNIANANVAGYSRQQVELATAQGQFSGAGYFGKGVDVVAVTRSHNEFLTRESASAQALAGMDVARLEQLRRLEGVFRTGETGLGHASSAFLNAMVDMVSRPADLAARQVVLSRAADLAARFAEAGATLDESQASVNGELRATVAEVNSLAQSIAEVNQRIAALRGIGQPPNDLLDERERLVARLSQHVKVSRIDADDGSLAIFIGGGQRLVLGNEATKLQVVPDAADPSRSAVAIVENGIARPIGEEALGGGSIAGLLRFQNQDLTDARNLIGRLAAAVAGAVNQQQSLGLNLLPPLGQSAGTSLFDVGPTRALPNAANARDAGGNPIGSVALTITDAGALQPSEYDLRENPAVAGSWLLTRLLDGKVSTVVSGDVVDGMRIDFGAPQAGDRFLLQPVTRAANGMKALLDDPRSLAAAAPLVAITDQGNSGSVGIGQLQVNAAPDPAPVPGAEKLRITFTDDNGAYDWELLDSANATLVFGAGTWQPGQPVQTPALESYGYTLHLSGVPRSGDIVTVAPTPASTMASNNGNALALLGLRDAGLADGRTAVEAWSQAIADIGVRVQSARTSADISTTVAGQAELARSSQAGVNLDEEAARLIQYQQSYQAAAKVLQVAQTLFDTLLQVAAGR
ncbi:MAG: flagellar hook-associated protein FlgK [Rubrivivax sp.]|nr:flagellar hook-associated protein FlgK [Rubrivivax sp.]